MPKNTPRPPLLQIRASAGSGKTYTLTQTFLRLLDGAKGAYGTPGCLLMEPGRSYALAEILAATFTNKAAAEMKTRVLSGLKQRALARTTTQKRPTPLEQGALLGNLPAPKAERPVAAERAEAWVELILRCYGALNIRTIDSLLTALVRLSALELGLSPDFTVSFDPEEYFTPIYDDLMDALVERPASLARTATPADDEALSLDKAAALRRCLSDACRALLVTGESKGFSAKNSLRDALFELTLRLLAGEETPRTPVNDLHRELHRAHGEFVEAGRALLRSIQDEQLQAAKPFLSYLEKALAGTAYEAPPKSVYADKPHLDDCLNKSSRGQASEATLTVFRRFRAAAGRFDLALRILLPALGLAPLTELARELHRRIHDYARTAGLLPLPAVPRLARQVLGGEYGVSDALCRLGSRLTHILLDEFQDTGNDQWQAVRPLVEESLSRGGTLTYVGDVKQAIYSWHGSKTALFERVRTDKGLTAVAGATAQVLLNDNWRSRETIIAHNNAFFSRIADEDAARDVLSAMLPADTPEAYLHAAVDQTVRIFSEVRQSVPNERAGKEAAGGRVRLYTVQAKTNEEVRALVRERLQRLLLYDLFPRRSYGDVAVLVRTGTEGSLIASWLTQWGIPVVTENSFLLREHPLISDLVSLLTFLEYPLDDASFWEFLSGRECFGRISGIPAAVLNDWLAECSLAPETGRPALFRLFRERFPEAWRLWLHPFFTQAGLMSAYDTVSEAVYRFALFDRCPEAAPFLRRFLEVAHSAETQGYSSLAAFLSFWKRTEDSEKIPLPESMNAVRIMTVHQAKGLEFPVVILPFHHGGRRREKPLHVTKRYGLPLLTRAGQAVPEVYYPACVTDELERLNLLYVAWTRPVDELHAFLTQPESSRNKPLSRGMEVLVNLYRKAHGDAFCLWEDIEDVTRAKMPTTQAQATEPSMPERGRGEPRPLPEGHGAAKPLCEDSVSAQPLLPSPDPLWRPMSRLPSLKVFRASVDEVRLSLLHGPPEQERRLSPEHRGTLAHLCLEHLRLTRPKHAGARKEDVDRAVQAAMRLFPLPIPNPEGTAEDMRGCLNWFAALPEAAFWLYRGRREQPIMDAAGNIHRVDLLLDVPAGAPGPDGKTLSEPLLRALDYKTGHRPQEGETYQEQVRRYMQLFSRIRNHPVAGTLVYLDERRLEEVRA